MRLPIPLTLVTGILCAALVVPAAAVSKRKQCKQACGGLIATCAATTGAAGFGALAKACKKAVLKRCRQKGVAACGVFCGNGTIDAPEQCDGTALGAATCASLGFASGTLGCAAGCRFDTSGCVASAAPTCGNGTIEAPEQCDGPALGGATCANLGYTLGGTLGCTAGCGYDVSRCGSQAFAATGQTTCWDGAGTVVACAGTGQDGERQAGAPLAYVDNGDGTISDLNTGLMWEKQSDDGSIHDWDNSYSWADAFAVHVAGLNGASFAGYTDWRVPNVKELQSIVNFENVSPAVSPAFDTACAPGCTVLTCSCTASADHWSASTYANDPASAWLVYFSIGGVGALDKAIVDPVRAVRGGSGG